MAERGYSTALPASLDQVACRNCDVVVIGSGIAGMTVALALDPRLNVVLISKEPFTDSSTYKAQGGIAVAIGQDDSADAHSRDTLQAGQGACREEAVGILTGEGPAALAFLQALGADFCRRGPALALAREAAHSCNRVVHYYDYTGRHIAETLSASIGRRHNITRLERAFLVDLVTAQGECCGCIMAYDGSLVYLQAAAVVVAAGGYSGLFGRSTNAASNSGDGIVAAYRAGAVISDMEFVQFHPTATLLSDRVFLLTEALRGEGAVLCNAAGERFMFDYHPAGELAPRDEVARAILRESERQGNQPVYLDARQLGKSCLADRFRQVYTELAQAGCAMERELIPVFPAAHYSIGGIKTDLSGETTIPALFACGEAAATGVHGANRLASNSLLEGVVFGRRVAAAIEGKRQTGRKTSPRLDSDPASGDYSIPVAVLRSRLDCVAGVRRRGDELEAMLNWLNKPVAGSRPLPPGRVLWQERNARQLAELLLEAALLRQESRGAHFRSDYPGQEANCSGRHSVQQWGRKAVME